MPRLTNADYIKQHKYLRNLWLNHQQVYSYISPKQQWELHGFYSPSRERTYEELILYRREATLDRPNLPHQAGRALAQLKAVILGKAKPHGTSVQSTNRRSKARNITVRGVVNPEINLDKFMAAMKRYFDETSEFDRVIDEARSQLDEWEADGTGKLPKNGT